MTRTSIAGFAIGALAVGLVAAGASYSLMGPNDTQIVTPVSVNAADTRATDGPSDGPTDGPTDDSGGDARDDLGVDSSIVPSGPSSRTPTPRSTDDNDDRYDDSSKGDHRDDRKDDRDDDRDDRKDDRDDRKDDDSRAGSSVAVAAGVTLDRARAIALGAVNGTIREAELDDEDGRTVWEVELTGTDRAKWEVTIDAVTGKVLETERY